MQYCKLCGLSIKPYQAAKTFFGGVGMGYRSNNSSVGVNSFGGVSNSAHLGCYRVYISKMKFYLIFFFIGLFLGFMLLMLGMMWLFTSTSFEYIDGEFKNIVNEAKRAKGISTIVISVILIISGFIAMIFGEIRTRKFVRTGNFANDYIDKEAKLIYESTLKQAKKYLDTDE
ncbi:hypothetical protein [Mesoplasma seiffertii]|uniref:hypothetical protein n=1 Tax=Mesoplasma seiffertii TaxID=28224 RepID=UPI00047AA6A6|nr:hypothetical protein [Mesoplasma seiffertii]